MQDQTIPIEPASRLKEDLALSSLQQIRLIDALETGFGITLQMEDFKESNFISLLTLTKMLEENYAL